MARLTAFTIVFILAFSALSNTGSLSLRIHSADSMVLGARPETLYRFRSFNALPGTTEFTQNLLTVLEKQYTFWNDPSTLRERDSVAIDVLKSYWTSVGATHNRNKLSDSTWQESYPWSGVFISWVMKKAGAGAKFKYTARHAEYIVWARENARTGKKNSLFYAYDIKDKRAAWPEPGDLICKNRDGKYYSLSGIKEGCIAHSDIVVEVDRQNRTITTIGGNINNTVHKRVIKLNENGFIDRKADWSIPGEKQFNSCGSQHDYFAIIKIQSEGPFRLRRTSSSLGWQRENEE